MATAYISEYAYVSAPGTQLGNAVAPGQAGQEPSNADQTIAIGGASAQSNAFAATTRLIRVHVDAICSIAIGSNPTATATTKRMAANQTEYFGVTPGHKIAVITNV